MKGKISAKKIESELSLVRKKPENKENSTSNFNVILKKYRLPYLKSERSLVILKSIH